MKMKSDNIELGANSKFNHKHPSFGKNISEYFSDYTSKSTIHGVRYLGEKKRSLIERLFWLVFIGISLYFCTALIVKSYKKWKTSPEIVSLTKNPSPIWQIPFPAITVCPETKSRQRVFNFTEAYLKSLEDELSEEEKKKFEQVSLVCDSHLHPEGNDTIEYDVIDFLAKIAPQFEDTLWQCKWINQNETCANLLTPILTEEGVCYTFNMLDREELFNKIIYHHGEYLNHGLKSTKWTLEKGYPKDKEFNSYPRRAIASGQRACFSLLMTQYEPDLDYICRGPVQGFKILLHNPSDIPRVSQHYLRVPLNQELVVSIKPNLLTTSEGLKSYNPEDRQCYFDGERKLKYFQVYTQSNCEVECLSNYTLRKCGCVSYHMPHAKATRLCGAGSTICVHEAQVELLSRQAELNLGISSEDDSDDSIKECNCMPSCTSLTYNTETSQADFNWPKVFEAYKVNFSEFPGVAMTRVTFFFSEQQFTTSERNELYGLAEFLGNCGGLLALFIGLSFLSLVEVVYFLTLRLFVNVRNHGQYFWSGSNKLLAEEEYKQND